MDFDVKFRMNDKAYCVPPVKIEYPKRHANCDFCGSSGMVWIKGKEFTCPACQGRVEEDHENKKMFFGMPSKEPLTIGQIRIIQTDNKTETTYMCKETGINCGLIYSESKLFHTYEEACQFVKEANEKMANGTHWSEL